MGTVPETFYFPIFGSLCIRSLFAHRAKVQELLDSFSILCKRQNIKFPKESCTFILGSLSPSSREMNTILLCIKSFIYRSKCCKTGFYSCKTLKQEIYEFRIFLSRLAKREDSLLSCALNFLPITIFVSICRINKFVFTNVYHFSNSSSASITLFDV